MDKNKDLLYMSRSEIPSSFRNKNKYFLKQICIYSFPRKILKKVFRQNSKSNLENFEDIEILRFLEAGYKVKMVKLSGKSMAVDVPEDIKKMSFEYVSALSDSSARRESPARESR